MPLAKHCCNESVVRATLDIISSQYFFIQRADVSQLSIFSFHDINSDIDISNNMMKAKDNHLQNTYSEKMFYETKKSSAIFRINQQFNLFITTIQLIDVNKVQNSAVI